MPLRALVLLLLLLGTDAIRPEIPAVRPQSKPVRTPPPRAALDALGKSTAIFAVANGVGFGLSACTGWHYHLDLIGTGVFSVSALVVRGTSLVQRLSAGAVAAWSAKLASFLFYRALQMKRDARLEGTLSTVTGAAGFWFISFLWGVVVSLPHTLAAVVPAAVQPAFGATSAVGLGMFLLGLLVETLADGQKWAFKSNPANRGRFCDAGVWSLSQHPNWLGNLLLWSGVLVMNAPALLAPVAGRPRWRRYARFGAAALGPLFLLALFSAQANGSIANAVELAQAKYGADPRYEAYLSSTPLLFPTLRSLRATLGLS